MFLPLPTFAMLHSLADCTVFGGRVLLDTSADCTGRGTVARLEGCHVSGSFFADASVVVAGRTSATVRKCTLQVMLRTPLGGGCTATAQCCPINDRTHGSKPRGGLCLDLCSCHSFCLAESV
jgi:hypothetical protein